MTDKKRCSNKAEYIYSWNGELIKGCREHARAMAKIGSAMGVSVELRRLTTEEDCMHDDDLDKITEKKR